ncbi:MAG: S-layer homology domain-containing protein, partial [Ruminococcaceae bacterium]|nr:S-layer homology domain-containing protein [Oscillospiraceae bacterium]
MTKRIISFICIAAMLMSMFVFSSFALTIDETLDTNWNAMAVKYSTRTKLPITVTVDGAKVPKTEGFEFAATADGGIDMGIPSYATFAGAYGSAIVTSEYTTDLADLSVEIDPDNFDFQQDSLTIANSIGILWSEDPIENVDGLATADATAFNGLRHLIPSKKEDDTFQVGVPVAEANAAEISGKALYVGLTNAKPDNAGTKIASNVNIVYFDGHYINKNDGHPGYRWTFTSRNGEGPLGDASPIIRNYENVDLSEGLKITIREDAVLGFVVNINGKDYCDGKDVGFFPDADTNGRSHEALTQEDYENKTDKYLTSMTYAREDIDLTGLKEAGKGYLTIGVTGINDQNMVHGCDIVVDKINTHPAATWKGEPACYHEEKAWEVTSEANCGYEGVESYVCTACGKVFETKSTPIVGEHVASGEWKTTVKPDCANEGLKVQECTVCGLAAVEEVLPVDETAHNKAWKTTAPTCDTEGLRERYCKICDAKFPEENQVLEATGHTFENYVVDEGYNCLTGGTETAKCNDCDATDTREKAAGEHTAAAEWVVTVEPNYGVAGEETLYCAVCGEVLETREVGAKEFPDVPVEGQWYSEGVYYCASKGYITGTDKGEFNPNGKLTREQFVVILARVAGADLTQYTESPFADVVVKASTMWYAPSVIWAYENEFVNGV